MNKSSSSLYPDKAVGVPELDFAWNEGPQSPTNKNTRRIFYLRIFIFFLIEAPFIALAAACLAKPIVLNTFLSFSDSEIKGGFTIIFVVWQSCATLAGGHILADAFSREWSVQSTRLRPGMTDRVSTITSGFLDRAIHLLHRRASGTFKLAFFGSLVFMALTQLAPGTISVVTINVDIPVQVQIGTTPYEVPTDPNAIQFLLTGNRASLIIHVEQIENSPLGLILQPNWLMTIPALDLATLKGVLEYDSDVVSFRHDCHWEAPRVVNASGVGLLVVAGGQAWATSLVVNVRGVTASSISPLSLTSLRHMENMGLSAFLFIGGNDTFSDDRVTPPTPFAIDLGTLPTTFFPGGVGVEVSGDAYVGPLASVLVCDPHLEISGGRVRLTLDGTLSVIDSGRPVIGNFPPSAANLIFSNAFQVALIEIDGSETHNIANTVASAMFMADPTVDWNTAANVPPADIATINEKMDTFMLSAGKAFINAYRKVGTSPTSPFNFTTTAPATVKEQRLALATSKILFYTIIMVFVLALALLCALCRSVLTKNRYLFDLHGVFSVLQEDNGVVPTNTVRCQNRLSLEQPLVSNAHS